MAYQAVSRTRCTDRGLHHALEGARRVPEQPGVVVPRPVHPGGGGRGGVAHPRQSWSGVRSRGPVEREAHPVAVLAGGARTRRRRRRGCCGRTPRRAPAPGPAGGRGRRTRSGRGSPAPPAAAGRPRGCPEAAPRAVALQQHVGSSSSRTTRRAPTPGRPTSGVAAAPAGRHSSEQTVSKCSCTSACSSTGGPRRPRAWRAPRRARPARRAAARRERVHAEVEQHAAAPALGEEVAPAGPRLHRPRRR